MHKQVAIIFIVQLYLCLSGIAQEDSFELTPTPDKTTSSKLYIPNDLEDCLSELRKMLPLKLIDDMTSSPESDILLLHDGLGRWIRNNWGLWSGSRLAQYFEQLGVRHAEDMSAIILTSFWGDLHGKPIRLEEQVRRYAEYWERLEEMEAAITPVSPTVMSWPLRTYDGKIIRLADYDGDVIVLIWWDPSCKRHHDGCRMVSHLVRLKEDYARGGFEVIGMPEVEAPVSRRSVAKIKRFVRKYEINFVLVHDDIPFTYEASEYDKFHYMASPQILIFSRRGEILKRIRGFDSTTTPAALLVAIEEALGDAERGDD